MRLQEKPRRLLIALAEQPGKVLSRDELRERLWPEDTFVAFEDGLNTAVRKLREALGDDPQSPRYVETVRGRGYCLVAPIELIAAPPSAAVDGAPLPALETEAAASPQMSNGAGRTMARAPARQAPRSWILILCCVLAVSAAGAWYWLMHGRPVLSFTAQDPILIASFDNQTGDPRFDNALDTALNVSLEQSRHINVYSRLQVDNVLRLMERKLDVRVTPAIGREICQRESIPGLVVPGITRTGSEYLLTAQLIDPSTGAAVRSYSERAHNENQILSALDSIATTIRVDLGESHYDIHQAHRPLPEVTTASLTALKDYADGAALFSGGKPQDAVRLYLAAIGADPSFAMAHAALGTAYYSFYYNEPAEGEEEFRKALALADRATDRERAWIEVRYADSQGRVSDATALYRAFLQQYPGDLVARYNYARLLRMHDLQNQAIPVYEEILRQDPSDSRTYLELASVYGELAEWPQSIQAYEKALSLDPSMLFTGNIDREYGFTLVKAGQEEKAEQVFSAMLADVNNYGDGERSLAFLDLYHGRYASAHQHFMLALNKSKDPFSLARIRYELAVVAAGQGSRLEQVAELDRIMANFDALGQKVAYGSLVGQAYARAGEVEKARKLLVTIAPMVNDRSEVQAAYIELLKAEIAAASGDDQTALQFLKPPAPGDAASTAILTCEALAHVYQQMGKPDQAIAWYQRFLGGGSLRMLSWEPQQQLFDAYYNLAQDFWRKGDRTNATNALNELLTRWGSADPNLPLLKDALRLRAELTASH